MEFKEKAKIRIDRNIQKLEDIKQAQIHFKQKYNRYAENADILLNFLLRESIIITKTVGEIPDSLISGMASQKQIVLQKFVNIFQEFQIQYLLI